MTNQEQSAYRRGCEDYGWVGLEGNPYKSGSTEWYAWNLGWNQTHYHNTPY